MDFKIENAGTKYVLVPESTRAKKFVKDKVGTEHSVIVNESNLTRLMIMAKNKDMEIPFEGKRLVMLMEPKVILKRSVQQDPVKRSRTLKKFRPRCKKQS